MNKSILISEHEGVFTYGFANDGSMLKDVTELNKFLNDYIVCHEKLELLLYAGFISEFKDTLPIYEFSKKRNLNKENSIYTLAMKIVESKDISFVYFRKGSIWEKFDKYRFMYELRKRPERFENSKLSFRNRIDAAFIYFGFPGYTMLPKGNKTIRFSKDRILSWLGL